MRGASGEAGWSGPAFDLPGTKASVWWRETAIGRLQINQNISGMIELVTRGFGAHFIISINDGCVRSTAGGRVGMIRPRSHAPIASRTGTLRSPRQQRHRTTLN